eukprot:TRINITY_DN11905_c0_g1_i1.p1 TRINITY_DN11905_c0_g1~~TRINITY_DN11905_c0_g1_i1.p1  ORF type:complete len:109 (-),score=10.90 TRINITY_DN11905_c0_g1_i1:407-733(-)
MTSNELKAVIQLGQEVLLKRVQACAEQPPVPLSDLDKMRNLYLGVKIIRKNETVSQNDMKNEGFLWVREEDLPTHSTACQLFFNPTKKKKYAYRTNKENVIVWIDYNY